MKEKTKKFWGFIKRKKFYAIGVFVLVVLIALFAFKGDQANADIYTLKRADFEKTITVSGKIIPAQSADLSFETGGTVAIVYKNVGDKVYQGETIAAVNSGEIQASRQRAESDLLEAEAELSRLRSESSGSAEIYNNTKEVVDSIGNAFFLSDDAVHNKTDQYFDFIQTSGKWEIKGYFDFSVSTDYEIDKKRNALEKNLEDMKMLVSGLTVENYNDSILVKSRSTLVAVKDFLDILAPAVNALKDSEELSPDLINKYKSDLSSARTSISSAFERLTNSEQKLKSSVLNIPVYEARVKSAQANVASFDAQIRKTLILAPFTGVVSLQDAKVGESVSSNEVVAGVISSNYEVELYVPEVNIIGLELEEKGVVTLDADRSKKLDATVTHIDPAETIKDGVSNYKVKLSLNSTDPIIRSGMTADVSIVTAIKSDVVTVPERAIAKDMDKSFVWKYLGEKTEAVKTEIQIGERDGKGNVELLGGLSSGDKILLTPLQ